MADPAGARSALARNRTLRVGQSFDFNETLRTAGITAMALIASFGLFWIALVAWSGIKDDRIVSGGYPAPAAVALAVGLLAANAVLIAGGAAII